MPGSTCRHAALKRSSEVPGLEGVGVGTQEKHDSWLFFRRALQIVQHIVRADVGNTSPTPDKKEPRNRYFANLRHGRNEMRFRGPVRPATVL